MNVAPNLAIEDHNGMAVNLKASIETKTGNTESRALKGDLTARFRSFKHHLLFLNTGVYNSTGGVTNDKVWIEHLRYRYDLTEKIGNELYVQHEYNAFRRLKARALTGFGMRFMLCLKKNMTLSFSPSYMVEYEKVDSDKDEAGDILPDAGKKETNHRLSNNLVLNLLVNNNFQIAYTMYFQPRISDFKDFRILSEFSIVVPLTEKFDIEISTSIAYDKHPPFQVKNLDTNFNSGLGLNFKVF